MILFVLNFETSFCEESGVSEHFRKFLKKLNNSDNVYFDPKFPEMEYKTLHEIDYLTDLKFGRFHQFLNLFNGMEKDSEKLFETRRAVGAVANFLLKDTVAKLAEAIITNETGHFFRIRRYWQVFYYCITTYNFLENVNPCTSAFQTTKPYPDPLKYDESEIETEETEGTEEETPSANAT
ncbi:unnamed protein product [Trichobilharzia szidati]|nr:unnamed protein product [Trichobilharzia szidati]